MNTAKSPLVALSIFVSAIIVAAGLFLRPTGPTVAAATNSGQFGRFQISAAGGTSWRAYVIDTTTGQVWDEITDGDSFRKPKPQR